MVMVTSAQPTYTLKTMKEEVANTIERISRIETPIFSALGKKTVGNTNWSWLDYSTRSPAANAALEGDAFTAVASTQPTQTSNTLQISKESAVVTRTAEVADKYGRSSEMGWQIAEKGVALRRDIEFVIQSNQARVTGDGTTIRKSRSLPHFLQTNRLSHTNFAAPSSETAAMTDEDAYRDLTQALLLQALANSWSNGARPTLLVLRPIHVNLLVDFEGRVGSMVAQSKNSALDAYVDVITTSFGRLEVVPSSVMNRREVFGLDPARAKVAFLNNRRFATYDIPVSGDATAKEIVCEWGLEVMEKGHFIISGLNV